MKADNPFNACIQKFGRPLGGSTVDESIISEFRGKLPDDYLDFLQEFGTGKWLDGRFQLCNPAWYRVILLLLLEDDPDLSAASTHAIGFSCFGELFAWNEKFGEVTFDFLVSSASCPGLFDRPLSPPAAKELADIFIYMDEEDLDVEDYDEEPMFERLNEEYGQLKADQCYAPEQHPALGGPVYVQFFKPVDADVAMARGLEASPLELTDYRADGIHRSRVIGPQWREVQSD